MKKPITIGVIAVIATILVTSAIDYSAIGAKPVDQVHLETSGVTNGIVLCPNGSVIETQQNHVSFTENFVENNRGQMFQTSVILTPDEQFHVQLWGGDIQSGQFTMTGIGSANQHLADFCGEQPHEQTVVTIWGDCGINGMTHFESELGYSGSFTGNVLCV